MNPVFRNDPDSDGVVRRRIHDGRGAIEVKSFFRHDDAPNPAILLIYNIPPGASEGVHSHGIAETKDGSFDEFYYVIAGRGEMKIADQVVPVQPGDHIFTPSGVAHGIENTSPDSYLKVYVVAVRRG